MNEKMKKIIEEIKLIKEEEIKLIEIEEIKKEKMRMKE